MQDVSRVATVPVQVSVPPPNRSSGSLDGSGFLLRRPAAKGESVGVARVEEKMALRSRSNRPECVAPLIVFKEELGDVASHEHEVGVEVLNQFSAAPQPGRTRLVITGTSSGQHGFGRFDASNVEARLDEALGQKARSAPEVDHSVRAQIPCDSQAILIIVFNRIDIVVDRDQSRIEEFGLRC